MLLDTLYAKIEKALLKNHRLLEYLEQGNREEK
jgi:hypothetical protein